MAEEETSSRSAPGATDRNAFRRRSRAVNGKRPPGSRGKCRAGVDPVSPYKGAAGIRRLLNALRYSLAGLRSTFAHEAAFRQEVALAAVLVPLGLALPRSAEMKILLTFGIVLVLVVELLNSAIEATVDRVSLEDHELARRAKDIGSAAVLVSLLLCGLSWTLFLWQRLSESMPV
jgi:diacylglycerol kinase (ATP)